MAIPFVDLKAQYQAIKADIDAAVSEVIESLQFIGGSSNRFVTEFEANFADYIGVAHCVGCANGTDALEMSLEAAGIAAGDEVIVPSMTWISTGEAVTRLGATPVIVDIDPASRTIDPARIELAITERTKAIIPVHLYGHCADMPAITRIARRHGLFVLEDAAQAHGASYDGKNAGTFGDAAIFSFYPGKNLGAYGDAGAVVTNDASIAAIVREISNHGQSKKHHHERMGRNSRLDGIQAAVLNAKLPYLPKWTRERRRVADSYASGLAGVPCVLPQEMQDARHVWHLYVIQLANRDEVMDLLRQSGVSTALHYPRALSELSVLSSRVVSDEHGRRLAREGLSLPIFPELSDEDVAGVCHLVREVAQASAR